MLSKTLTSGLEIYHIGQKIRALRLNKALGLAQLGEHAGLSPGMLSKIERGQLFPTLLKIAMVFGVGLEHFFLGHSDKPYIAVVRKKDRLRLPDRPEHNFPSYFFESLDFPVTDRKIDTYYAEFEAQSVPTEPHQHVGAETIYVIKGQLVVRIESQDTTLCEGDSMYFDSGFPYSYWRHGRAACSAIVVVAQ